MDEFGFDDLDLELDDEYRSEEAPESGEQQALVTEPSPDEEAGAEDQPDGEPETGDDEAEAFDEAEEDELVDEAEDVGEEEDEAEENEDVLEETPEFLRDAPEDDELWFEQGEPKDFDF